MCKAPRLNRINERIDAIEDMSLPYILTYRLSGRGHHSYSAAATIHGGPAPDKSMVHACETGKTICTLFGLDFRNRSACVLKKLREVVSKTLTYCVIISKY